MRYGPDAGRCARRDEKRHAGRHDRPPACRRGTAIPPALPAPRYRRRTTISRGSVMSSIA